jgi:hypothetical protein
MVASRHRSHRIRASSGMGGGRLSPAMSRGASGRYGRQVARRVVQVCRIEQFLIRPMAVSTNLLRSKQQPDGTWLLENTHPGKVHFTLEDGDGRPSRWNALRALRVLSWYGQ